MDTPNWLRILTSHQGRLRKVLILAGLVVAVVIGISAIPSSPTKPSPKPEPQVAEPPGTLASRDMVITGIARDNQTRSLQAADEIELLKSTVDVLKRQLELVLKPKPTTRLTPEQMRQIARQEISLSKPTTPVAPPAPLPSPPRWQRVGPETVLRKAEVLKPEPKWVTIPAGSTAKAILDDGLAWIGDQSERFYKIRIADIHTPNGREIPMGECHVMMRSELLVATEVVARLPLEGDVLSCVLPNGEALQVDFKGYAMTSDNVQGIEVKVFSNDLDILKEFGKAAIPVALARAIDGATRIATTPLGTVTQRGSSALSDIAREMSRFYLDTARVYARKVFWARPHQNIYVTFRRQVQLRGVTPKLLAATTSVNRRDFN